MFRPSQTETFTPNVGLALTTRLNHPLSFPPFPQHNTATTTTTNNNTDPYNDDPTSPIPFNPSIMHSPISPALTTQTVLISAPPATLAHAFNLPEPLVSAHWITSTTPVVRSVKPPPPPPPQLPAAPAPALRPSAALAARRHVPRPAHIPSLAHAPPPPPPGADPAALRRRLALLAASRRDAADDAMTPPATCRCAWAPPQPIGNAAAAAADVVVAGSVVGRRGRGVYRGACFSATVALGGEGGDGAADGAGEKVGGVGVDVGVDVGDGEPWARYAEAQILVGGGVCVGVGDVRTLRNDRLVGATASSVGFHDSGKLVHGSGEWTSYCAPFKSGDTIGVLIHGGGSQGQLRRDKQRSNKNPPSRDSPRCDQGSASTPPGRTSEGSVGASSLPPTSPAASSSPSSAGSFSPRATDMRDSSHRINVSFSVNGVFGPPIPLEIPAARKGQPGPAVAIATSLYNNEARVRAACCEPSWRRFASAAKAARPAPVSALCAAYRSTPSDGSGVCSAGAASNCQTLLETCEKREPEVVDLRDVRTKSRPITVIAHKEEAKPQYDSCSNVLEISPLPQTGSL